MGTEILPLASGGPAPMPAVPQSHPLPSYAVKDVMTMAENVAKSRLFPGIDTPQAAFTLMMLCQSEGLHPMQALKRYHIIEGRPSMRADAMQAEMQARGWSIKWVQHDKEAAEAVFSHPRRRPEGLSLRVTFAEMKERGITNGKEGLKKNWRQHPDAMLRARLVSMAVRMEEPGIVAGIYTPEEVIDFAGADSPEAEAPAPIDNGSGHGRGSYASPEQIRVYREKLDGFIRKTNAEWGDRWTAEDGEIPDDIKGELVNTWQVDGHLLKWAVASGRLDQRIVPAQAKTRQLCAYVAIVYHRAHDRRELVAELKRYVADEARKETEKWFAKHPESSPDEGEAHGSALGDDGPEPAPVGVRPAPEDEPDDDSWPEGRQ